MRLLRRVQRGLIWGGAILSISVQCAFAKAESISLDSSYQLKGADLTTEKVWEIDPTLQNAHLRRWALRRHSEIFGLKADLRKAGVFGVSGKEVQTSAWGYIRGAGPWYRPWDQFECHGKPNAWFSQAEGAEHAVAVAADFWSQVLKENLSDLEFRFAQVQERSAVQALDRGEQIFKAWLKKVEGIWRQQVDGLVRSEEWKFYRDTAQSIGACRSSQGANVHEPFLASMMEPVQRERPSSLQLLARAPARLWNGLFSIRANITFAGKTLNGRFLLDSTAPTSQISPSWLESQGIYPAWIYVQGSVPEGVRRSGMWRSSRPLARRVRADRVEVSGLNVALDEFLLTETEFFTQPSSVGSCCDGVLGLDFLRLYPMEFRATSPAEVRIWPRSGFSGGDGAPWLEISELPAGEIASSCHLSDKIQGLSWDFANENGLQIHTPWAVSFRSFAKGQSGSSALKLICSDRTIAQDFTPTFPLSPNGPSDEGPLAEKEPGMSLGMSLLGESDFTLDLPHGRIWFAPGSLPLKAHPVNRSGLRLAFRTEGKERVLRVMTLNQQLPALALYRAGLRVGMRITQVDAQPADELDEWEVNQKLSGARGPQVSLQWLTKTGSKVVSLPIAIGK